VTKRSQGRGRPRVFVLDCEALSQAVHGDRHMTKVLDLAAAGEAEVITSPITVVEAYDGRVTERRWDWILSRVGIATLSKDEARAARRLLAEAGLHGHKYAIDAALAVVARQQKGDVTVFTSDVDDLERLLPPTIIVRKI
jgi:hypothetical protein